jgi:NAD(P)-dependent dehydrogenase (short-subunit alcohol dehydrogenase family)
MARNESMPVALITGANRGLGLEELSSKSFERGKNSVGASDLSPDVGSDRAVVGLGTSTSPGCSQLKFKFGENTIRRLVDRAYKRL